MTHIARVLLMKGSDNQAEIRQRLHTVLERLQELGISQAEVARCVGIASQYLSDVKAGRKRVTKLFALRLGACYEFDHKWLLQGGDPPAGFFGLEPPPDSHLLLELSVFDRPICGDPGPHPDSTATVDVSGPAAQQADRAKDPYLLRFAGRDPDGGLRQNDLILISQKVSRKAKIQVVRQQQALVLARKTARGTWRRVDDGQSLGRKVEVVGNCLGIVWRQL
jgi:transcriptional regulator with XRE-family HTH domain